MPDWHYTFVSYFRVFQMSAIPHVFNLAYSSETWLEVSVLVSGIDI